MASLYGETTIVSYLAARDAGDVCSPSAKPNDG
jgi:hypothetical protein